MSAVIFLPTGVPLPAELLLAPSDDTVPATPIPPESLQDLGAAVVQLVRTHQQEQDLNHQITAANDQLHDANQGLPTTKVALLTTQGQQKQLNDELEARVAERTQALREAMAEA